MNELTGTGTLSRLILRRDRFITPVWIFWLALVPITGVAAFKDLYPTLAARQSVVQLAEANLAFTVLYGKVHNSGIGALVAWRYSIVGVFAALAGFLTVIRHTRTDEEAGRRELLGSTVVGRYAPISAALIAVFGANLVLGGVIAGLLVGQGLSFSGSVAMGLAYIAPGWVFAAIGVFAAQLTQNAGSARGLAGLTLGLSFLLRAVGDVSENSGLSWLSWLSPLGWTGFVRPFAGERWWIFGLVLGAIIMFSGAAYALSSRRDLGAGVLPPRVGPAAASPGLRSPLSLAWRLQRTLLISWTAGIAVYGLLMGSIIDSLGDIANPQLKVYFARIGGEATLIDISISVLLGIAALAVSAYAIQATLKLRIEEIGLRTQPLLATAVGRLRYAGSHLVFAIVGPAAALAVGGIIMGLTYGAISGDIGREVGRVLPAAMVQLPAVWIVFGITIALFGLAPRFASAAWAALAAFLILGLFGDLFKFPEWTQDISPFNHIPKLPGGKFALEPIVWLTAIAAALIIAGLVGWRRRDIA